MQDEAKIHTSKKTQEFLEGNGIKVLDWFPKGCDLNPIEHVWSFIKNQLYERKEKIKNQDDVFKHSNKEIFFSK